MTDPGNRTDSPDPRKTKSSAKSFKPLSLASGQVEFSDGHSDFTEVVLHRNEAERFLTIGVGSGGMGGMSAQLTPAEFICGDYDDVINGLQLTWLLQLIKRIGPQKVTAADIQAYFEMQVAPRENTMIYASDLISETTKNIIRKSNDDYIASLSKQTKSLLNLTPLNGFGIVILIGFLYHATQGPAEYIWIWSPFLLIYFFYANRMGQLSLDIALIALNPDFIAEFRGAGRTRKAMIQNYKQIKVIGFTTDSYRDIKYRIMATNLVKRISFQEIENKFMKVKLCLHEPISQDTPIQSVQKVWNPECLDEVLTPGSLPRMNLNELCPSGSFLLEVSYIEQFSAGKGNSHPFSGYFLSAIVSADGLNILDCRFEQAS